MANAAKQLHDLLAAVRAKGELSLADAWADALGAEYGSPDFAVLHAQVVALLSDSAVAISALRSSSRDRIRPHVAAWWEAVVMPNGAWAAQRTHAREVISDGELESLANAADIIEAQLTGSDFAPYDLLLQDIDRICVEWAALIPQADLPVELERALVAQVDHLRWMVSKAALFGVAPISREALRTVGSLSAAAKEIGNHGIAATWRKGCAALAVAVTTFTGAATLTTHALEATNDAIQEIEQIVSTVSDLGDVREGPSSQSPDDGTAGQAEVGDNP